MKPHDQWDSTDIYADRIGRAAARNQTLDDVTGLRCADAFCPDPNKRHAGNGPREDSRDWPMWAGVKVLGAATAIAFLALVYMIAKSLLAGGPGW